MTTPLKKQLVIRNKIPEIARLEAFVEETGEELHLSTGLVLNLNLALEEAVSNIIQYAYPPGKEEDIVIDVQYKDHTLVFVITDTGKPFDPTQAEDADITLPLEERPIGGLGIFLIKKIMNEVEYQRIDESNVYILKKKLTDPRHTENK